LWQNAIRTVPIPGRAIRSLGEGWLPGLRIKNDWIRFLEYGKSDQAKHDQCGEAGEKVFFLPGEAEGHTCRITGKGERFCPSDK
jgi:hypothetical protein